jgi:DNA-binding NarL/FixJ family response regulator
MLELIIEKLSTAMPSLRILIADDHAVVRAGLRALLESRSAWEVCAEAADGRDAVEKATKLKPDIAVLDIGMPLLNGVEATRRIRASSPRTEILILTMHQSDDLVHQVVEAGARGYILKDDADRVLLDAVDALRRHLTYFSTRVSTVADSERTAGSSFEAPRRSRLTPREREVLQLLAEGKSNKEVSSLLGISVNTTEAHRANIMLKLDLHSITELVHYAVRNKIIKT